MEPRFETYDGDDPFGHVMSLNFHRRHLTASQKAIVFAKIAKLPPWRPKESTEISVLIPTQDEAAKLLGISVDTGQFGKRVVDDGVPELIAAVERGEIAVSTAADPATRNRPSHLTLIRINRN